MGLKAAAESAAPHTATATAEAAKVKTEKEKAEAELAKLRAAEEEVKKEVATALAPATPIADAQAALERAKAKAATVTTAPATIDTAVQEAQRLAQEVKKAAEEAQRLAPQSREAVAANEKRAEAERDEAAAKQVPGQAAPLTASIEEQVRAAEQGVQGKVAAATAAREAAERATAALKSQAADKLRELGRLDGKAGDPVAPQILDAAVTQFKKDHWTDGQMGYGYLKPLSESMPAGDARTAVEKLAAKAKAGSPLKVDDLSPFEKGAILEGINGRAGEAPFDQLTAAAVIVDKKNHWVDATVTPSVLEAMDKQIGIKKRRIRPKATRP